MESLTKLFKFIWRKVVEYGSGIDNLAQDFMGDLKSFRVQLVYAAYAFNAYIIYKSPEQLKYGIALLTVVYGFYFASKVIEHKVPNADNESSGEPNTDRDPDSI